MQHAPDRGPDAVDEPTAAPSEPAATGSTSYRPAPNVVFEVTERRALLLNDAGTHLVSLNAAGTTLWQELARRERTVPELVATLHRRYPDQPREQLVADCTDFVRELVSNGLLDAVG